MRLRFAPSPTGALHIGGARTALYNWLAARHDGADATFLLRIEDTDRERSTPENVRQILDALEWLELDFDEGPIYQSEQAPRHAEVIRQLLDSGHAYRSTATADDVKAYKAEHGADRGFRGDEQGGGAVRLGVPDEGESVVRDVIRGDTVFRHVHQDDPVIARADGSRVYNFAVAIDDMDAEITHVVRGDDHLSNTPKQLLVLEALDAPVPVYGPLPLLHGPDGKKLSKRHGAASVQELRDAGYLPEAVVNYVALLGAGFAADRERFTAAELAERFDLSRVSRHPAVFDEQKLRHMNGIYLRELGLDELTARVERYTGRTGLADGVAISREKIQTLADFWPLTGFVYDGPVDDPAARERVLGRDGAPDRLRQVRTALAELETWDEPLIKVALWRIVENGGVKPKDVFQPLRVAIAGTTVSPGIFESIALLGRDETLRRMDMVLR